MFKIVNDSPFDLPKHAKYGDAGMDLKADLSSSEKVKIGSGEPVFDGDVLILKPNCRVIIPTSIKIELPIGFEAQIRPRSGLSFKSGLTVYLGTIDASYRGEIGVIVGNYTNKNIEIPHGERIAQMVIAKHETVEWEEVEELSETERGVGGFGHTGRM